MDINTLLEYVQELGSIPVFSINDLECTIDILKQHGYTCYISPDTDYLIVEVI